MNEYIETLIRFDDSEKKNWINFISRFVQIA